MYQVPKYIPKIRLIARDGRTWEYKNITEAADELYRIFRWGIREQIGDQWVKSRNVDFRLDTPYYFYYPYILQNDFGDVVTVDELMDARSDRRNYYDRWRPRRFGFEFRNGPVPYIGKYSRGGGYRHMGTMQEVCEADALLYDEDAQYYGIKARGKRNRSSLPTDWDDYWRPFYKKNWKSYRKNQWKDKK